MAATKPSAEHSRRCGICRHPDRHLIELKFIEWGSPTFIARQFALPDRDTVYRHARATGLFECRLRNISCLKRILEESRRKRPASLSLFIAAERLERALLNRRAGRPASLAFRRPIATENQRRRSQNRVPKAAVPPNP